MKAQLRGPDLSKGSNSGPVSAGAANLSASGSLAGLVAYKQANGERFRSDAAKRKGRLGEEAISSGAAKAAARGLELCAFPGSFSVLRVSSRRDATFLDRAGLSCRPTTRFPEDVLMYRRDKSETAGPYLASLFGGLALVGICYYGVTHSSRPQVVAQATPDRPPAHSARPAVNAEGQASPQGPTGPIETKSGGAPAASPQGDTPSGMQAVPEKPDQTTSRPSK